MDRKIRSSRGFTLIELMVVASIVILLLAWGMPSYSTWKKKHDVESQIYRLFNDLQYARMTAYTQKVVSGVWWGTGNAAFIKYQVRTDGNADGDINDAGVDKLVGSEVAVKTGLTITPSANQNSVSFDGRGFLSPKQPLHFSIASSTGAAVDCVDVSNTRVFVGKMNAGTCGPQ